MTGLHTLFKEGITNNDGGLYHCDSCENPGWYMEPGDCPKCGETLIKML